MAFPGNAPAASDYQIESFAVDPRARAGAVTPDQLVIPDPRDAWHYMVNAASLQCVRGYIVPKLAVVSFQPGLNGNSKNRSRGEGALQGMVARGFQPVPHDFPVVAWGEPRTQAHPSTYLRRWDGVHTDGHTPAHTYSSAWDRPRAIGSRIVWSHDADGYLTFLRDLMRKIVQQDDEDDAIIEIAAHSTVSALRAISGSVSPAANAERQRLAGHLPIHVAKRYAREFPFLVEMLDAQETA